MQRVVAAMVRALEVTRTAVSPALPVVAMLLTRAATLITLASQVSIFYIPVTCSSNFGL